MIEKSRVKLRKNWNIKEKKTEKNKTNCFLFFFIPDSSGQKYKRYYSWSHLPQRQQKVGKFIVALGE